MYLIILLVFIALYSLHLFYAPKRKSVALYYPAELTPYPIIGHLPQFLKNRHRILDWLSDDVLAKTPTNTFILRRIGVRGVITANPANVEHILRTQFDNYPKGEKFRALLHDFLGHGIFNSDGEVWRIQRKTASFEFNTKSLRSFVVQCVEQEIVGRLLPLLKKACDDCAVIDMQDVLERFAFDNVCKVAFNFDPCCLANNEKSSNFSGDFALAFRDAAELSSGRFRYALPRLWMIKKLLGIGSERRLKESINMVHNFAMEIIRSRIKQKGKQCEDDLLSRFINNEEYSEEFLRDIIISFILAGRETTSSALSWFFWLLSSHPHVETKIHYEILTIRSQSQSPANSVFEFDELKEMHYLHAAITESMRLYPPVPVNSSSCGANDILPDGTEVKKGWFMSYNAYAMGRTEAIWGENCREYIPERWLDEEGKFRPESPFKFPVFHAGPRICLGKEMAYIQMKSIAASVMERFVIEVLDKEREPVKVSSLTLRMSGGLPVFVKNRSVV